MIMNKFEGVQYAVVNDKDQVVCGAGGDGYAMYKTLLHAEKKLRWGHGKWRVVEIGFTELEVEDGKVDN